MTYLALPSYTCHHSSTFDSRQALTREPANICRVIERTRIIKALQKHTCLLHVCRGCWWTGRLLPAIHSICFCNGTSPGTVLKLPLMNGNGLPYELLCIKQKQKIKYYVGRRYIKRSFEVYPGFPWLLCKPASCVFCPQCHRSR